MSSSSRGTKGSAAAVAITVFAGVWLLIVGAMEFFQGLIAVADDTNEFYLSTPNYLFSFNLAAWGWIHMIAGVLAFLVGLALLNGATWARIVGVVLAALVIVGNFLSLPYYPVWSIIVIAASAFVIWGLLRAPDDLRDA